MKNGILITIGVAVWAALKGAAKLLKILITLLTEIVIFFGLYIPLFYLLFGLILLATTTFTLGGSGTNQIIYYVGLGASCLASAIISIRNLFVKPLSALFAPLVAFFRKSREKKEDRRDEFDGDYPEEEGLGFRDDRLRDRYGYDRYDVDPRDRYGAPVYEERAGYDDSYDRARTIPAYSPYGGYERAYPRDPYYSRSERPERVDPYGEPAPVDYPSSERYADRASTPRQNIATSPYADETSRFDAPSPRVPESERPLIYYSERRPGILVMEYSDRFELYREDQSGRVYVGTEYKDE